MATVVYVGCAESNEVRVLGLDPRTGDLTPLQQIPIPGVTTPGQSTPMAVSPDRRFLYVEVAHAVLFLASDEASSITGHTLAVTGGR